MLLFYPLPSYPNRHVSERSAPDQKPWNSPCYSTGARSGTRCIPCFASVVTISPIDGVRGGVPTESGAINKSSAGSTCKPVTEVALRFPLFHWLSSHILRIHRSAPHTFPPLFKQCCLQEISPWRLRAQKFVETLSAIYTVIFPFSSSRSSFQASCQMIV
jgi:hypothetical protein